MKIIRIGIIGCGRIANGAHLQSLQKIENTVITALCDIDPQRLRETGDKYQVPVDHRFLDYRDLIACVDVDAVEICTPNYLHCEMAVESAKAGKPFNVEKPLSVNLETTLELQKILQGKNVPNMMCFSYRFKSAVRYAKDILDQGLIGEIININVSYLQSGAFIPGRRLEWRFDKEKTGTGALADLGVHLIDMAILLFGDIITVSANTGTVIKKRKLLDSEEYADVLVDDFCNFIAKFSSGASGIFNVTRCAIGHANTIKFDVFGREGVISFNLNQPDTLDICIGKIDSEGFGMHTVKVPERYKASQEQAFIDLTMGKQTPYLPTISDGIKCQRVLDAIIESAEQQKFVTI